MLVFLHRIILCTCKNIKKFFRIWEYIYIYNVAKFFTKLELIRVEISLKKKPTVNSGYFFVV